MTKSEGANSRGPLVVVPWVDNMKLLAMLGVLSFHFFLFFSERAATPAALVSSWKDVFLVPFQLGWQGNELFFAASGFGLALSRMRQARAWPAFIATRAWRIYLPYWTTISLIFAYQVVMHAVGSWDVPYVTPTSPREWFANVFLVNLRGTNYLSTHHWFLFTLIPLYILFPLFFRLCERTRLVALIILLAIQIVVVKSGIDFGPFGAIMSLTYWMGSFAVGILLGIYTWKDQIGTARFLNRMWPAGVLLWLAGTVGSFSPTYRSFVDPVLCAGALLCIYQLAKLRWSLPWLNSFSFEIYLVHMPFVGFYRHFFGFVKGPLWLIYPFYLISTVMLSWVVHIVVVGVMGIFNEALEKRRAASGIASG
ncbi:hypothetical protein CAL29_29810 [Bordetella genomosp. 10]|uniref:Acyltransferase 3 domain-containing protein n=1 Tax=Bordetella genomosp. 10 TaxID=1416804 RepID=A0A261S6H8_9BORD|nr:acyltransferase [Bordetella genomosp. 10]OZI32033.1 hypothetical protein CAL29_29810 [Bordetella genomosp. 10]